MEHHAIDTTGDLSHHPAMQLIVWCFGHLFWLASLMVQDMSLSWWSEFAWTWGFRALSALSLILIIAINWDKGWERIKKVFSKTPK